MEISRKDVVMKDEPQVDMQIGRSEAKLSEVSDEGTSLSLMKETRGWKNVLYKKFIEPRMSRERLLGAKTGQEREEVWAAVSELNDLMVFIEGRIKDGQKASEALEAIRKGRK